MATKVDDNLGIVRVETTDSVTSHHASHEAGNSGVSLPTQARHSILMNVHHLFEPFGGAIRTIVVYLRRAEVWTETNPF
jgi:hypothetical protein